MPLGKYPVCSGPDLVKALNKIGYELVHQKGSHNHKELDRGTLKSILRKLSKFVSEEEILSLLKA